jgi:hypothetical protein
MKDDDKIEDVFEWFVLTVEAGLRGSFPQDIEKRISHCKKQIKEYRKRGPSVYMSEKWREENRGMGLSDNAC